MPMNYYNRALLEAPPVSFDRQIQYAEALQEPLAESYGTTVVGISSQDEMHEMFATQATYLLHNIAPDLVDTDLGMALRTIRSPHKRENVLWEDSNDEQASAHVLVPYTPQYGCMTEKEIEINKPLHMTFGLLRATANAVAVARTNIWVSRDHQSLKPSFRALKDTNANRTFETLKEANDFFENSTKRSRARAGFVVARMLKKTD